MHGSPMGLPYGFAEEGKKPASLAGLFLQSGFLRLRHPASRLFASHESGPAPACLCKEAILVGSPDSRLRTPRGGVTCASSHFRTARAIYRRSLHSATLSTAVAALCRTHGCSILFSCFSVLGGKTGRLPKALREPICSPFRGLRPSVFSATPVRKLHFRLFKMPVLRCLSEPVS